jgi:hypothetical protein
LISPLGSVLRTFGHRPSIASSPAAPTLSAVDDESGESVTISVVGDAGAEHSVFIYGTGGWNLVGTVVGDGSITATGLSVGVRYQFIAVSSIGGCYSLPSILAWAVVTDGVTPLLPIVPGDEAQDPSGVNVPQDLTTNFPQIADLDMIYSLIKHQGDFQYPLVPFRRLLVTGSEPDDIHEELPEEVKRFGPPILLRTFFNSTDQRFILGHTGLTEDRPVTLHITVPHLVEAKLAWQDKKTKEVSVLLKPGDLFTFSEEAVYEVREVHRGKMFANTDIPLFFEAVAEVRHGLSEYYEAV